MPATGSLRRLAILLLALLAGALTTLPAAAATYPVTGDLRFQFGFPLPFPIGPGPPPTGQVVAVPGATLRQYFAGTGVPMRIVLPASQLSEPNTQGSLAVPLYVFGGSPYLELQTALGMQFPRSSASFQASGRSGFPFVTFCPGNTLPTSTGFACFLPPAAPGVVRYQRTANQFGGPARARVLGSARMAFQALQPPPCSGASCLVIFAPATPLSAFGGPFGFSQAVNRPAPSPGLYTAIVGFNGTVLTLGSPLGQGLSQDLSSFAGPWTTGRVTVSQPSVYPPQLFVISGSDARTAGGQGSISLVSGGIARSPVTTSYTTTRAWLNLTIGAPVAPVPLLRRAGLAVLVGLTTWTAIWAIRRKLAA